MKQHRFKCEEFRDDILTIEPEGEDNGSDELGFLIAIRYTSSQRHMNFILNRADAKKMAKAILEHLK